MHGGIGPIFLVDCFTNVSIRNKTSFTRTVTNYICRYLLIIVTYAILNNVDIFHVILAFVSQIWFIVLLLYSVSAFTIS